MMRLHPSSPPNPSEPAHWEESQLEPGSALTRKASTGLERLAQSNCNAGVRYVTGGGKSRFLFGPHIVRPSVE